MSDRVSFTVSEILTQLKEDLWCKEIATGYTTSYTWEANQLGHFTIGFAPTVILGTLLAGLAMLLECTRSVHAWPGWAHHVLLDLRWLAPLIPVWWLWRKEGGDVAEEELRFRDIDGLGPLDIAGIRADARTALAFCAAGAVVGAAALWAPIAPLAFAWALPLIALLVVAVPCAWLMRYWLIRKMCYQRAGLPYTFRLSYFSRRQVAGDPDAALADIDAFIAAAAPVHLVIAGHACSGKTSLAVAVGTELGFDRRKVRYIDFGELLDEARTGVAAPVHFAWVLWGWADAEILVVDDTDPAAFLQLTGPALARLRLLLAGRRVVWTIAAPDRCDSFHGLLGRVFPDLPVRTVVLRPVAAAEAARAAGRRDARRRRTGLRRIAGL